MNLDTATASSPSLVPSPAPTLATNLKRSMRRIKSGKNDAAKVKPMTTMTMSLKVAAVVQSHGGDLLAVGEARAATAVTATAAVADTIIIIKAEDDFLGWIFGIAAELIRLLTTDMTKFCDASAFVMPWL